MICVKFKKRRFFSPLPFASLQPPPPFEMKTERGEQIASGDIFYGRKDLSMLNILRSPHHHFAFSHSYKNLCLKYIGEIELKKLLSLYPPACKW